MSSDIDLQDCIKPIESKSDGQPNVEPVQLVQAEIGTSKNSSEPMRLNRGNIVLTVYVILALALNGAIKPFKRGFFCDDMSIRYPVKDDTIKFSVLAFICLFIPWLCFRLCDKRLRNHLLVKSRQNSYKLNRRNDHKGQPVVEQRALLQPDQEIKRRSIINSSSSSQETDDDNIEASKLEHGLSHEIFPRPVEEDEKLESDHAGRIGMYKVYVFGLATTVWLTGMGKVLTGRMRPHFFEKCRPDIDCTMKVHKNVYIEKFQCTNIVDDSLDYFYITTSWPSGHASIIFYSMIYIIIYVNKVVPIITKSPVLRQYQFLIQMLTISVSSLLFALAGYISMTRITDYHHHSTDVVSGIIIGSLVAILWYKALKFV